MEWIISGFAIATVISCATVIFATVWEHRKLIKKQTSTKAELDRLARIQEAAAQRALIKTEEETSLRHWQIINGGTKRPHA